MKTPLGVIYDLDDTLLDNYPEKYAPYNIHEISRLKAAQTVGKKHGIVPLQQLTFEQNLDALLSAKEHSIAGATWKTLLDLGIVEGEEIDRTHHLVLEVSDEKDAIHAELLRATCVPTKGAVEFIQTVAQRNIPQAVASGAALQEIKVFLQTNKLLEHFEDHRLFGRGMYEAFKPHPASFDAGFRSLGLEDTDKHRAAVIAFEDDPKGVESAKRAGLFVCALTTRFDEEHFLSYTHKPDIIADTFASLLATGKIGNFTV